MPFTVDDFRDLLSLLEQHPELRTELRHWVLSEELLPLPQAMRALADAQLRTGEQVEKLSQQVSQLGQQVSQLSQQVSQLGQQVSQLTRQVERLVEVQGRIATDLDRLKGSDLERRYRERAYAYFSRLVRRGHVLSGEELSALLDDAVTRQLISEAEADQIMQADVVVRGQDRETRQEVYLVVEVSWGVGLNDVERAVERAAMLARTGISVIPVVAGTWVTPEAENGARGKKVWQVTDGHVAPPGAA